MAFVSILVSGNIWKMTVSEECGSVTITIAEMAPTLYIQRSLIVAINVNTLFQVTIKVAVTDFPRKDRKPVTINHTIWPLAQKLEASQPFPDTHSNWCRHGLVSKSWSIFVSLMPCAPN